MTPLLQEQLEIVLRDEYRVLRELGGGGMSHVFLAEDVALGRKVVIKVLTPELAAGVNRERFQREIKLLATLQHPLLVPVLAAGEGDGLVWYSMPFVEGESLRDRIRRGPMPAREALAIVADVAQGLAAAHARGVVHRDVKPENVLLSGGRAIVADFGIAKALSEASTAQAGLTATGIAVGTPAYMAPEQAAGDPDVDARADIYAMGCVAYELLSGTPPFEAPTPAQLLMAHVVQPPEPLATRAPAVSAAVNDVVMRALAKVPGERWPTAQAFADAIEEVRYGATGERTATRRAAPAPTAAPRTRLRSLLVATLSVVAGTMALSRLGFVPTWGRDVAFGLGVVLAAAVAVLWRAGTATQVSRLVRGSAVAAGLLVTAVAGHGALRAAGVGPFASIISSGKLAEQDRVLVAEFTNRTGDAGLGDLIVDALRTDLTQSKTVRVVPRGDVVGALARMSKPGAVLDSALAIEVAQRQGIPAVMLGTIQRLGKSVVIRTRLVTPAGEELAAFRETAAGDDDVIAAVDRLSKAMRGALGESLRSVAAAPALEQVSTASLPALRAYTAAIRTTESFSPDAMKREVALLDSAVRLDSTFAMAWRRLGVRLASTAMDVTRGRSAIRRAHALRDRLAPVERSLTEAAYYSYVQPDEARTRAAYEAVLAEDPDNAIALNNTTSQLFIDGEWAPTLARADRLIARDSATVNAWTWRLGALMALGRTAEMERSFTILERRTAADPARAAYLRLMRLQYGGRTGEVVTWIRSQQKTITDRAAWASLLTEAAPNELLVGRPASARRAYAEGVGILAALDTAMAERTRGLDDAVRVFDALYLRSDTATARALYRRYLAASGGEPSSPARRFGEFSNLAALGEGKAARALLTLYRAAARAAGKDSADFVREGTAASMHAEMDVLMAEGRGTEALAILRQLADSGKSHGVDALSHFWSAFALAGQRDSALVYAGKWLDLRDPRKLAIDKSNWVTPRLLIASCRLADEVGDVARRARFCGELVALWRDAEAELQPVVADAKARMAREAGRPVMR
jgi:tRNA A-37 threonylcarbamoyl transferase component Bud32/tetratricopeptide (TPR) repeat protein